jgi:hypothetical protein
MMSLKVKTAVGGGSDNTSECMYSLSLKYNSVKNVSMKLANEGSAKQKLPEDSFN